MVLPLQEQEVLKIKLREDTLIIRSEYFSATTENDESVVVRLSNGVIGIFFEIHEAPTVTVLVRAQPSPYAELLVQALEKSFIKLPYFKLRSRESAP